MVLGVKIAEIFSLILFVTLHYTMVNFSDCSSVMEDGLYSAYSCIDNFPPNPRSSMETAESWKHVVKKFVITFIQLVILYVNAYF